MGAVSFWSGQLLSASGQPRVRRSTVRRPCGLLPGLTGLVSSAPHGWVQLPQLSGNGGGRHRSAVQLSWRAGGPSAIRSRCSCSPLTASAARFSWAFLGSPPAASLGSWLACLAQSHLICKPPAIPPSPHLASVVGKGPCLTVLRSASLPLGPVGPFTSW